MNDEFPGFVTFYHTITVFVRRSSGRTGRARMRRAHMALQLYQWVVEGIVVAIHAENETHTYHVTFLLRFVG